MEDYEMILHEMIVEMNAILQGTQKSCVRLATLTKSAQQYLDRPNKAALSRAYNSARRFVKYTADAPDDVSIYEITRYVQTDKYKRALIKSIQNITLRYMRHVMSM